MAVAAVPLALGAPGEAGERLVEPSRAPGAAVPPREADAAMTARMTALALSISHWLDTAEGER